MWSTPQFPSRWTNWSAAAAVTAPSGIVDCWPLDISEDTPIDESHRLGVFTVLRLVKALAEHDTGRTRLFLVTANAQAVPGSRLGAVDQAAIWGSRPGRRSSGVPGALGVSSTSTPPTISVKRPPVSASISGRRKPGGSDRHPRCGHVRSPVAPLRPADEAVPHQAHPDATYVVTGGARALGRLVAAYLAERGARHITLLGRSVIPPRSRWPAITEDDPIFATVSAIKAIERLGAQISTASVDVSDGAQVAAWLRDHIDSGGRPIRGVVHAAGSVDDQPLVNMSESDFAAVLAPKVTGARVWATPSRITTSSSS